MEASFDSNGFSVFPARDANTPQQVAPVKQLSQQQMSDELGRIVRIGSRNGLNEAQKERCADLLDNLQVPQTHATTKKLIELFKGDSSADNKVRDMLIKKLAAGLAKESETRISGFTGTPWNKEDNSDNPKPTGFTGTFYNADEESKPPQPESKR